MKRHLRQTAIFLGVLFFLCVQNYFRESKAHRWCFQKARKLLRRKREFTYQLFTRLEERAPTCRPVPALSYPLTPSPDPSHKRPLAVQKTRANLLSRDNFPPPVLSLLSAVCSVVSGRHVCVALLRCELCLCLSLSRSASWRRNGAAQNRHSLCCSTFSFPPSTCYTGYLCPLSTKCLAQFNRCPLKKQHGEQIRVIWDALMTWW